MIFERLISFIADQEDPKPNKFTLFMGKQIKKAREEAGISQVYLAEKIYKRRATLSDIENGKADVDASTLWLFSAYLEKPLSYFYPPYARENITQEEIEPEEEELIQLFRKIKSDNIREITREIIRTLSKYKN